MRITGIGVGIPSLRVSNQDVLARIADHSRELSPGAWRTVERSALQLMESAGADIRRYRDLNSGETARDLVHQSMRDALLQASVAAGEIDAVIYCSVSRAFVEPGNAYFFAHELGLRCECFDISDACMGWLRAAQVVQDGMLTGRYRNVLVICAEFGIYEMFDNRFHVTNPLDLRHAFATYTLGEIACATVLSAEGDPWEFHFRSRPDLADLCFFALPGFETFVGPHGNLAGAKPLSFTARSGALFAAAEDELVALLADAIDRPNEPEMYVPHAASSTAALRAAARAGVDQERVYATVMPRYGNVVSASLPLGLHLAASEGKLHAGADVVLCPASAGVTVGLARFQWNIPGGVDVAC